MNGSLPLLPASSQSLLVRTDFTDDAAWSAIRAACLAENEDGFAAYVEPVSDRAFDGANWRAVRDAVPPDSEGASVVFIVDADTVSAADHPVLCVDILQWEGEQLEPFRCVPDELWSVDNNINLANMDWDEFADNTDDDGVFRGF